MKKLLIVPLLLLSLLALPGCGVTVSDLTTTITNPVSTVDLYRAKNVYAASLELAVSWRNYCWSKSYAALMVDPIAKPVCQNRRQVVRIIQATKDKASRAIRAADTFIRENPTGNAVSYVAAAWRAVTDFQRAVPRVR